jgi:hypothetical protein
MITLASSLGPLAAVAAPEVVTTGYSYFLTNPYTASTAGLDFISGATNTPPTASLPALLGWGTRRATEEIINRVGGD